MNLLGGVSPTMVSVHIAAVTNAVPRRRRKRRLGIGAWVAVVVAAALVIIGVVL